MNHRKQWTRDECLAIEQSGIADLDKYELIEGELIQKTPKHPQQTRALFIVTGWLRSIFGQDQVIQEGGIDVSPEDNSTSYPEPDAVVINHPYLEMSGNIRPSDIRLLVEVSAATLNFDLGTKARLYARAAIPEYWVLDAKARQVIVHRNPVNGEYRSIVAFSETEAVSPLASPDSVIVAGEFFS